MTLPEAIEAAKTRPGVWFRPVIWKHRREGFTLSYESTVVLRVPSQNGGHATMTADVGLLVGEWEIISADQVLEGK